MQVVFIYGPPAAGKLTVAALLAQRTGFALYDNHRSIDRVQQKYEYGTPEFMSVVSKLRKRYFRESARKKKSFVFTFCYVKPHDDAFISECIHLVEGFGGQIFFVQLLPSDATLLRRVQEPSRRAYGKIVDDEQLLHVLQTYRLDGQVPGRPTLQIQNDTLSPSEAVDRIIVHYHLSVVR